jgi:hypothetical protein
VILDSVNFVPWMKKQRHRKLDSAS